LRTVDITREKAPAAGETGTSEVSEMEGGDVTVAEMTAHQLKMLVQSAVKEAL